jgi:Protein of unknown function (DUF4238)
MADRHHYVSQFHLRWFIDPASEETRDPWLWVGDREQQNVSRRAPKNIGWFRGIFDGPGAFANRDLRLEEFLANKVEAPAAHVLRNWVRLPQGKRAEIPPEVLRYLAWAAARSLPMRQLYEEWLNAVPVNAQYVEPPPAGYEKIQWSDGGLCMEHPILGIREDVRRNEVDALRAQGWQARIRNEDFPEAVH